MWKTAALDPDSQVPANLEPPIFTDRSGRKSPRPSFSSNKPYWIGPPAPSRSATLNTSNMAQKVQIHYTHPGVQPPVYVAGSLSESQWQPVEMEYKEKEDGNLDFWCEFNAEPGEYQYKFRLGPGDWWVLDETKPTVDDGTGNRNNQLVVGPESSMSEQNDVAPEAASAPEEALDQELPPPTAKLVALPGSGETQQSTETTDDNDDEVPESEMNLLKHETMQYPEDPNQDTPPVSRLETDMPTENGHYHDDEESPLFEHEAGPIKRNDSKSFFDSPMDYHDNAIDDDEDDVDTHTPLFRHETMSANDSDPDEAPLFRHESMSPTLSATSDFGVSPKRRLLNAQDTNDPSLEPFPTDPAGILAHLHRTETRLPEDETMVEGTPPSPSLIQTKSFGWQPAPASLRSDASDLSPHLDCIDETEETDEAEPNGAKQPLEKKDSVVEPVPIAIKIQDVSEISDDNPLVSVADEVSNRGPPTPPMTPDEHHDVKTSVHDGPADTTDAPQLQGKPEAKRTRADNETDNIAGRSSGSKSLNNGKAGPGFFSNLWFWFAGLCGGQGRATGVAIAMGVAVAAFAVRAK